MSIFVNDNDNGNFYYNPAGAQAKLKNIRPLRSTYKTNKTCRTCSVVN